MIKYANNCEISPKKNCFECGSDKVCKNCLNKKTRFNFYSTEVNRLKRLPENELGYMLPHYSCNFKKNSPHKTHVIPVFFKIWGIITV